MDLAFNLSSLRRTAAILERLERALAVNIRLHHADGMLQAGDIFLFNHFARFETFIPQYLIHRHTGALVRSVASAEFFQQDDRFSRYLLGLGAVPNDHPRLLPFLAEEILRGRKVLIFPEGGMVKDRLVLDATGDYAVYSRSARTRRKHHSGASVLASTLAAFKIALRSVNDDDLLHKWMQSLNLSRQELLTALNRPTLMVPGNITFYPLRVDETALHRLIDGFTRRHPQQAEELLVESNILLRNTDMDLRLGSAIPADGRWSRRGLGYWRTLLENAADLDQLFSLDAQHGPVESQLVARQLRHQSLALRDRTMGRLYEPTTINLSHLAASLLHYRLTVGQPDIPRRQFHHALFLAIRALQRSPEVHLHRGLVAPERYAGVIDDSCPGLTDLLDVAEASGVLERGPEFYRVLPKLKEATAFDSIRKENPLGVYINEAAPIKAVAGIAAQALDEAAALDDQTLSHLLFAEELKALAWARKHFAQPRFADINSQETASQSALPFWLAPEKPRRLGVLLVHGFLASPAELRSLGDRLLQRGYPVLGVRLAGHGSSPWDLRKKRWQDWLASVRRGIQILSPFVDQIALVGFSSGGALSLICAALHPQKLAGVVSCSAPLKFRNANLAVVPFIHSANEIVRRLSNRDGLVVFRPNDSEHPDINYRNIPVSALNQLRQMVEELKERLALVKTPCLLLQGSEDRVVDPISATLIHQRLTSASFRRLQMIPASRHGILNEDLGGCQQMVIDFIESLGGDDNAVTVCPGTE
ncbi:MAG TPA: alpha/beta fold hydrolase [Rhodospirillaceae bacterium]|nr:alpha/beta fold hydrolase [Rhodospirillaceae bacterium]